MKRLITIMALLGTLGAFAQCNTDTAVKIAKGNWICQFETDMGIAPLKLNIMENRADSVFGEYEYSTQYTGLVKGKIRGSIIIHEESVNSRIVPCAFGIKGRWSEVTSNGFTGSGNMLFDFISENTFNGYWTEAGATQKYKWTGVKSAAR